jgi:hypothetical protein
MHKLIALVVMSGLLGVIAAGCTLDAANEGETPELKSQQYAFTRNPAGEVSQVDAASLGNFTPERTFGHALTAESNQVEPELEPQVAAAPACSGSCNSTSCSCTGSLACCTAGCVACWKAIGAL